MNVGYERCSGAELHTADGRTILDFLSGYCVHNIGHNHPHIVAALNDELARSGPAMLQSHVPELAGELAEQLCDRAGGRLSKVFFCSSGSEGVEAVIKFARAHTGRSGMLYAEGAFHGLTCGALSLMGEPFWRDGFGPLLPDTEAIAVRRRRSARGQTARRGDSRPSFSSRFRARAAFACPLAIPRARTGALPQARYAVRAGRGADRLRSHRHVSGRSSLRRRAGHGGAGQSAQRRTGSLRRGADVGRGLWSVYGSLKRAIVHTSTFSENALAMRAGLATLDVLEDEHLRSGPSAWARTCGTGCAMRLAGYEMVKEVRGAGLLSGIEFRTPRQLRLRVPFEAFKKIHPGMFGQVLVMRLFNDKDMLTQICGNDFMVLKVAPPLVVAEWQLDEFVTAVRDVVDAVHSSGTFWSDALGLARRAVNL